MVALADGILFERGLEEPTSPAALQVVRAARASI